jgi:hypothetical protein
MMSWISTGLLDGDYHVIGGEAETTAPVVIEHALICCRAKGVTVGHGAVVGAGLHGMLNRLPLLQVFRRRNSRTFDASTRISFLSRRVKTIRCLVFTISVPWFIVAQSGQLGRISLQETFTSTKENTSQNEEKIRERLKKLGYD